MKGRKRYDGTSKDIGRNRKPNREIAVSVGEDRSRTFATDTNA